MEKLKTIEELGDDLCRYCPLEEYASKLTSTQCGCEGAFCSEAYDVYLEGLEEGLTKC